MSGLLDEIRRVRAGADCLHPPERVQAAYDRLAQAIAAEYAQANPVVLCAMVGGLVPTGEILRRLDFPLELDYLHATRYRGQTTGGGLIWKVHPKAPLQGRHVLVIDDILDEGHTLAAMLEALRALGPASLKTCVLIVKQHARKAPGVSAEFVGLEVEDRYVFGGGMDYKGYFRQLPGIYAVRE